MAIKVVFFDIGDTLVTDQSWMPGAPAVLVNLREQGMRLGLISNTGNLTRDELTDRYLPADFDFTWFDEEIVLLSSEVGVEKPALSMFTMAVNHAGVSPWETLFVAETIDPI